MFTEPLTRRCPVLCLQVSAVQQLLAPYDVEAGRRCGLTHDVAVTPLLAHLLFLAANGGGGTDGSGATALADTFMTAAFLAVARVAEVPEAFRRDVLAAHDWLVPAHVCCFDLFRWGATESNNEKQLRGCSAASDSYHFQKIKFG